MIALDRIAEIVIALVVAGIIFIMVLGLFVNATINGVQNRVNNLSIACSETPATNTAVVNIGGSKFYCVMGEKSFVDQFADVNLG